MELFIRSELPSSELAENEKKWTFRDLIDWKKFKILLICHLILKTHQMGTISHRIHTFRKKTPKIFISVKWKLKLNSNTSNLFTRL